MTGCDSMYGIRKLDFPAYSRRRDASPTRLCTSWVSQRREARFSPQRHQCPIHSKLMSHSPRRMACYANQYCGCVIREPKETWGGEEAETGCLLSRSLATYLGEPLFVSALAERLESLTCFNWTTSGMCVTQHARDSNWTVESDVERGS